MNRFKIFKYCLTFDKRLSHTLPTNKIFELGIDFPSSRMDPNKCNHLNYNEIKKHIELKNKEKITNIKLTKDEEMIGLNFPSSRFK